jgi:hypothetical protein
MVDKGVAAAYGLAAFHLQNALLTTLVAKGHLTRKEAALTARGALHEFEKMRPSPEGWELFERAKHILTIHAQGWETQAKGN